MKSIKAGRCFKILLIMLAAVICLCSCGSIQKAAEEAIASAVESAKSDISSAVSEQISEFKEGEAEFKENMNEVTEALKEASDAVSSVRDEAAEQISSVSEEIKSEVSEAVGNITTSAEETTIAADTVRSGKWYTFRNQKRFDEHYEKHGAEFGSITKEQYLQLANDLINNTSDRVLHKYSEDGDYMYFDQDSGHFLVLSEDGYIRTFFIPTAGINYWNRQ